MKTRNKRLLDTEENRKYYSKSDGNWMHPDYCTKAHLMLDRVAWVRQWVHKLQSQYHIDIGTKDGYTCMTLAAEGVKCVGFDPSVDAIEEADLRSAERDLGVVFRVGYLEDIPTDFRFHTVSCMEVLEHVVDVDVALAKLSSLGEYVLITTPDAEGRHGLADSEQNEEHVRVFTQKELEKAVYNYGDVIESVKRDHQLYIIFRSK